MSELVSDFVTLTSMCSDSPGRLISGGRCSGLEDGDHSSSSESQKSCGSCRRNVLLSQRDVAALGDCEIVTEPGCSASRCPRGLSSVHREPRILSSEGPDQATGPNSQLERGGGGGEEEEEGEVWEDGE